MDGSGSVTVAAVEEAGTEVLGGELAGIEGEVSVSGLAGEEEEGVREEEGSEAGGEVPKTVSSERGAPRSSEI